MEEIKNLFFFILLGGNKIKENQLIQMFVILADLSDISDENDFSNVGLNSTTIFSEKGLNWFKNEDYDKFIDYYKSLLLKNENFELVSYLSL